MSAARRFRIAAIPADGVGREVVAAGREVLDALAAGSGGAFAFDWQEFGWGCEYYARTGRMMADDGLTVLKEFDAIYFGAVGWPGVPDHISLWGLRLAICQNFDDNPETFLFYCDSDWNVLGAGAYGSAAVARELEFLVRVLQRGEEVGREHAVVRADDEYVVARDLSRREVQQLER